MAYVLPSWLIGLIIGIAVLVLVIVAIIMGWLPGTFESTNQLFRFVPN